MGARWACAAALAAWTGAAAAEVSVEKVGDRLSVRAQAAPVSEVLERLARQTGMKVVYEGAPPRLPITLTIERRTTAEAVLSLLEGLGINYALRLDERGAEVLTLVMGSAGPGSPPTAATATPPSAAERAAMFPPAQPFQTPDVSPDEEVAYDPNLGLTPPPPPQQPGFTPPPPPDPNAGSAAAPPGLGSGFWSPTSNAGGFSPPSVFGAQPPPAQQAPNQLPPGVPPPPPDEQDEKGP